MESQNILNHDSYDRFFPNQDLLPSGGFGNLIALPLQKQLKISTSSQINGKGSSAAFAPWSTMHPTGCPP
jgi:hypothetical protein